MLLPYSPLKTLPIQSLFFPVQCDRNCSHFSFAEAWDGVGGWFEVEYLLLDVGGEIGQVDDLRYAGAGDSGDTGDLGLILH